MSMTRVAAEGPMSSYPRDHSRREILSDGHVVRIRSIRPDDVPRWISLFKRCSTESIYRRFHSFFPSPSPRVAERFCRIDSDKQIAIVAESGTEKNGRLVGVARLVDESDRTTAEFAVLVADAWQDKGLGTILTDCCLKIAGERGTTRIVAQVQGDNTPMLRVLSKFGFHLEKVPDVPVVEASLHL